MSTHLESHIANMQEVYVGTNACSKYCIHNLST
jgi:hypothetical protein